MRRFLAVLAVLCAAGAIASGLASATEATHPSSTTPDSESAASVRAGRELFADGCSSCHGFDARGIAGRAPSLIGAGEQAGDFYLRTGRMPLSEPGQEPLRTDPVYDDAEIGALVAYLGSLGGPPIPKPDPESGSVSQGQDLFTSSCAGCHAITGRGGVVVGATAPDLVGTTPTDVAEAIRIGPFVMPAFSHRQLSDADVNSISRYVTDVVEHPDDRGGWGIGHIGPVPEGMVAWLLAAASLLIVAVLIGERHRSRS
jgi:ubiquinol-cytochrome c reductase cytochrome c subunit